MTPGISYSWSNFYYATVGSAIEIGLLNESESRKLCILNKTCPYCTAAGSCIETQNLVPPDRAFDSRLLFPIGVFTALPNRR